jgi:hypothetical protein
MLNQTVIKNKNLKKKTFKILKMNSSIIIQLMPSGANASTIYENLALALYAMGFNFPIEMLYLTAYMAVSIAGLIALRVHTLPAGILFCQRSAPLLLFPL